MKTYFISNMNKEEKEMNLILWTEIENNGKLLTGGWEGDYLVSTYIYNNKIYKLWDNMELGIKSEIEEYNLDELKLFKVNNKYVVAKQQITDAELWLVTNHPDEYFSSNIVQVDVEGNVIKNGDFSIIATKEAYKEYNPELTDYELISKIERQLYKRIDL